MRRTAGVRRSTFASGAGRKLRVAEGGLCVILDLMNDIGRELLSDEQASANYRMCEVRQRRTGEITWEVIDANSGGTVATGLPNREEALRVVRGWERLSQKLDGGLDGHVLVH